MRPSLSLKILIRASFFTAALFLLISAASFAIFSRTADYAVVTRETKKAVGNYHGVLAIDNGVPTLKPDAPGVAHFRYSDLAPTTSVIIEGLSGEFHICNYTPATALTSEQMSEFSSLPGASAARRYMTGGIIKDFKRIKNNYSQSYNWGYEYTSRFVIEGVFGEADDSGEALVYLRLKNAKQLAGDGMDGDNVSVVTFGFNKDYGAVIVQGDNWRLDFGKTRGLVTNYPKRVDDVFVLRDNFFGGDFPSTLKAGSKYLFIGQYKLNPFDRDSLSTLGIEAMQKLGQKADDAINEMNEFIERYAKSPLIFYLGDNDTIDWCPSFWELDGLPDNYLETEEFSRVREIIDITERDLHTFDIVYTDNMNAIPRFNEGSMVITAGKAIGSGKDGSAIGSKQGKDAKDANKCVISQYFADTYNLNIGDKLTVELGDKFFAQQAGLGTITYIPERKYNLVSTVELEISGIYLDVDSNRERNADQFFGYSPSTIFVPLSLLPVEVSEHEFTPGEFSVYIENARDIDAFLEKAKPLETELGIKMRFSDGGWSNVKNSINISAAASFITVILYLTAAFFAVLLSIYIYIERNKKSYAIMRALGTPHIKARNALMLPLGLIVAFALPVGGALGLYYTSRKIAPFLETMSEAIGERYISDASLPANAIIICLLGQVLCVTIITALFLRKLRKTPPLTLLMGNAIYAGGKALRAGGTTNAPLSQFAGNAAGTLPPSQTQTAAGVFVKPYNHTQTRAKTAKGAYSVKNAYSALSHISRYISRHMRRAGHKTALAVILTAFLISAAGLLATIRLRYKELFDNIQVKSVFNGFTSSAIDKLSHSELVKDIYFHEDFSVSVNRGSEAKEMTVTNDIDRYLQDTYTLDNYYTIDYLDGYSGEIFKGDSGISKDDSGISKDDRELGDLCVIGRNLSVDARVKIGDNISLLDEGTLYAYKTLYYENEQYRNGLKAAWSMENTSETEFNKKVDMEFKTIVEQNSGGIQSHRHYKV